MPRTRPMIILVIDDELEITSLISEMLRRRGYAVLLPPHGFVAENIARLPFDLLLTDLVMPVTDGFAVIQAVRAARPDAAIVAFSGFDPRTGLPIKMPSFLGNEVIGADMFIAKPLRSDRLQEAITSVLAKRAVA